jgi:hypothetical protein
MRISQGYMHMPRVTLYVTDDLKARMDEAGKAMNWSAIAQRAFRKAVLTQAVRKAPNMTNVVERLRASKERVEAVSFKFGQDCGGKWAREAAEYDELERVAKVGEIARGITYNDPGLATLQAAIEPEGVIDQSKWRDFWERFGDGRPTDAFARGFIEGATQVYKEVADRL